MKLIDDLKKYKPFNEQETADKEMILYHLENTPDVFCRENSVCHVTTSAWVVNKERTKVLMAYHKIYDSWAWLGGHADGESNLIKVAMTEACEESGIKAVTAISDGIYSVEVLTVDGHIKRGKYVSSHLHLNITYLLEASEDEKLHINEAENSDVAWLTFDEVFEKSNEKWFKDNIYSKLIDKLKTI